MNSYSIKYGQAKDEEFLWEMLYQAIYTPEGKPRPTRDILNEPEVAKSMQGWGRKGDTALMAFDQDQNPIGAVWVRLYDETNKTYGYVDSETPLLGMALVPEYRGKGIGTALLAEMLRITEESGYPGISLSVDPNNPALHLYKRFGFKKIGVDGTSWDMLLTF